MSTLDPGCPPTGELPFFVYGTLLPGEPNHDLFLRGRTSGERAAVLPRALLYDGPGYPYAIDGHGRVHGTLLTAAPGVYGELLGLLDHLEEYLGPGHPRNLYERVVREVELPGERQAEEGAPGGGTFGDPGLGLPRRCRRHPVAPYGRQRHRRGAVDHRAASRRTGHTMNPGAPNPVDRPHPEPRPDRRSPLTGGAGHGVADASASVTPASCGPRKCGSGRSRASRAAFPDAASSRAPP
ncbi:Uncharacterized conserved protein YtfP, gamma-glutamylcyclotransferase (GGCT)/AIG2-like family [Streptomyces sp. ScaeMP-e83]|nr:Uncharacterized conserved protein YtfP, gamma-glutamylcyclotransferase (GGCT)/AIG2-like family [Streptomyces sp. ScaeMP-e83]